MKGKGIDVHKSTQAGFYQEYPEVYESVKASDFRWFGAMDVKIINSGDHSNLGKEVHALCFKSNTREYFYSVIFEISDKQMQFTGSKI